MATLRDTFSSQKEIDNFLESLNVKEIQDGDSCNNTDFWCAETHDTDGMDIQVWINTVMGDNVTDEHLDKDQQRKLDSICDNMFLERLDARNVRAHDTGLMEVLQDRLLTMTRSQMIEAQENMCGRKPAIK